MTRRASALVCVLAVVACARKASDAPPLAPSGVRLASNGVPLAPNVTCGEPDCRGYNVVPYVRDRSRYGIGCLGNVPPGTTPNPESPPKSYALDDISRVPNANASERALARRVRRYDKATTLRFAWVDEATTPRAFIIFDALDGPCGTGRPYVVLNGSCNEIYEPGENPYYTKAAPSCFRPTPRPWLSGK